LEATFSNNEADSAWRNLTHALSGMFCASIHFLANDDVTGRPSVSAFQRPHDPELTHRTGALPREGMCTENLAPWLKLLPCRDREGVASLLRSRAHLLRARYQALGVHLLVGEGGEVHLTQTLTVVLGNDDAGARSKPADWTMEKVLGGSVDAPCIVSSSSYLYLELDAGLVDTVRRARTEPGESFQLQTNSLVENSVYKVLSHPEEILQLAGRTMLVWPVEHFRDTAHGNHSIEIGMIWSQGSLFQWIPPPPTVLANRYLTGAGALRGGITIDFERATTSHLDAGHTNAPGQTMHLRISQVMPWFVRIFWHTLRLKIDGIEVPLTFVSENELLFNQSSSTDSLDTTSFRVAVTPSEDRKMPSLLQLHFPLLPHAASAKLTMSFEKAFLRLPEYPPDANHGFEIEGAVMHVLHNNSLEDGADWISMLSPSEVPSDRPQPLLQHVRVANYEQVCTNGVLLALPVPDFSMPYNVITFTSTLVALYFGTVVNALLSRRKRSTSSKHLDATPVQRLSRWLRGIRGRDEA